MATQTLALNSVNRWLADGSTTDYPFSFAGGYLDKSHVKAYYVLAGVKVPLSVTAGIFLTHSTLRINPAPPSGAELTIYRDTPKNLPLVEFEDGTALTEPALNLMARQAVFIAAEYTDAALSLLDAQALDPYGFKDMLHSIYVGPSTVTLADRGKCHVKEDGTSVHVPVTYSGFTLNILNTSENPMRVTFGATAYMQGSDDASTEFSLAANSMLHVTQASSTKFFIWGNAA